MTDRHRFRIRHGSDVRWGDIGQMVAQLYFEEMEQAIDRVRRGAVTAEEASRDILHRVWERAAPVAGWDYRREVLFDD